MRRDRSASRSLFAKRLMACSCIRRTTMALPRSRSGQHRRLARAARSGSRDVGRLVPDAHSRRARRRRSRRRRHAPLVEGGQLGSFPGSIPGAPIRLRPALLGMRLADLAVARCRSRRPRDASAGPNSQLLRSHPAIDPEETRDPATQEDPEAFSFIPHSARATGDESRSLLVSHDSIVVGSSRLAADRIDPSGAGFANATPWGVPRRHRGERGASGSLKRCSNPLSE